MKSLGSAASFVGWVIVFGLAGLGAGRAQTPAVDELKGKIFDAQMAQKTFAGLKYCDQLTGKSFYFQMRNRVLRLEEYFESLENMVKAGVFNKSTGHPWTLEDAKARWEEVKKQAEEDRRKCELVQSLPELEKKLQELEKNATVSDKKE